MTLTLSLERLRPKNVIIAGIVISVIGIVLNLCFPETVDSLVSSAFELTTSALLTVLLAIMWRSAKRNNYAIARTLKWMTLALFTWSLGDACYLYYDIIGIDTFLSFIDVIYITATVLGIVMVFTIPGSQPASRRKNMVYIEISILILSATVLFAVLLLAPGNPYLDFDLPTLLLIFLFPVLDIVFIWITLILYFSYPQRRIKRMLGAIFIGAFFIFFSDFFYLANSLYETLIPTFIVDLGYFFFYILLFVAGLLGFKEIRGTLSESEPEVTAFQRGNWFVFVPGILLIIVIGLVLILVFSRPEVIFHGIIVLISLIVLLFLIHQYLVIIDNIKLTREMREINQQLEATVEQRTSELRKANAELQTEMIERKEVELELAESNRKLALMNSDKDKMFTILAHDLRSSLGAIMKLSEFMVENPGELNKEELPGIYRSLHRSATQTFKLLNDLLNWSTVQMGSSIENKVTFNVFRIASEEVAFATPAASAKGISVSTDINIGLELFADKVAIQTVIRNLLSNAIKFTPRSGHVIIKAQKEESKIKISITDDGIGISEEEQKKLFRLDTLSSTKGTEGEKGSGFGLLLCKDLVERNGGEIGFGSTKDRGSTFYFTVPQEYEETNL